MEKVVIDAQVLFYFHYLKEEEFKLAPYHFWQVLIISEMYF
jgi:hypothetical protein